MPDDLRKNFGKAQVQKYIRIAEDCENRNDNFRYWNEALEAYANGGRPLTPDFYVVISDQSTISTPQKLQEIAEMKTAPKVIETIYTDL